MTTPTRHVALGHPALCCTTGTRWVDLWLAMLEPPDPADWLPAREPSDSEEAPALPVRAHPAPPCDPVALGLDRKMVRTMETQARLAVSAAGQVQAQGPWPDRAFDAPRRTGLYMGMPTVDEEVPPLAALPHWLESANGALTDLLGALPPFAGLSLLNSSAAAHVSVLLGLQGAMSLYSPFCDAGLNALIDGVLSVAEGENEFALIGGIGPKLNLLLPVQYLHWGWSPSSGLWPGEGAAFLLAGGFGALADPSLHLTGYARGFVPPDEPRPGVMFAGLLDQALTIAGRRIGDIGWILPAACLSREMQARQSQALADLFHRPTEALPLGQVAQAVGLLGPAEPLLQAGLAQLGLWRGQRLAWQAGSRRHREEPLEAPVVLLMAWAPHGQCVFALLEGRPR